mmetsp:Transcript_89874/g.162119  ORF Transcript_89874/g.162119 Transcript_89874/m.162119 type:complete len:228 (+) Transcript_89874:308-991(+)
MVPNWCCRSEIPDALRAPGCIVRRGRLRQHWRLQSQPCPLRRMRQRPPSVVADVNPGGARRKGRPVTSGRLLHGRWWQRQHGLSTRRRGPSSTGVCWAPADPLQAVPTCLAACGGWQRRRFCDRGISLTVCRTHIVPVDGLLVPLEHVTQALGQVLVLGHRVLEFLSVSQHGIHAPQSFPSAMLTLCKCGHGQFLSRFSSQCLSRRGAGLGRQRHRFALQLQQLEIV